MMGSCAAPVDAPKLLTPFLAALPAAAVAKEPAVAILPLLSPVLRQRVQVFSSTSADPWLRWLCYDSGNAEHLCGLARGTSLEPHPVSGDVEVDWSCDADTRYRRLDPETLQALVALTALGVAFQLVWCVNDPEGGSDGWRVAEVSTTAKPLPFERFGGVPSVDEAEWRFREAGTPAHAPPNTDGATMNGGSSDHGRNEGGEGGEARDDDDDDDDAYWARYDATPARTPGQNVSPAAAHLSAAKTQPGALTEEDDYYAQYDSVQPAMDNHDPDEESHLDHAPPPLGLGQSANGRHEPNHGEGARPDEPGSVPVSPRDVAAREPSATAGHDAPLAHPRPESSASSNRSDTVAKLEATADQQGRNEFGVKQHVSRSIRSLYMLSKSSGIDREEFEQLVRTELDLLGMMEEDA